MATIKQQYGTDTAVTITLASLPGSAGANEVTSSTIDNTTDKFLGMDLEINANWATGTADGTLDVYLVPSADGTTFADTDQLANLLFIGSVTPHSTNTTTVTKVIRVEQLPQKFQIHCVNSDTLALGTGSINYVGTSLTNA